MKVPKVSSGLGLPEIEPSIDFEVDWEKGIITDNRIRFTYDEKNLDIECKRFVSE